MCVLNIGTPVCSPELDLKEEKEKSSEMERKCGVCEKELQHVTEELEKAQLASQDLLHTVETFKVSIISFFHYDYISNK